MSSSKFLLSFFSAAQPGALPDEAETLPEMLKSDPAYGKYVAGHFGTWHLGVGGAAGRGLPSHHGFDQFFGTPTPPSLAPCDNGMGLKDAVKTMDKYGNPLGLQTEDTAAAAAAAAKAEDDSPLADDEEWIEDDDASQSSAAGADGPSRDFGLSFWAFWSLSSLLWQSILLSSLICWFAGGMTSPQCGGGFLVLLAVAAVPFTLLDNLSMSDPNSCMLIRNGRVVEQPLRMGSYASRVTDEAMHFLESQMVCSRHRCLERDSFMLSVSYALPPPKSLGALWDGITKLGPKADAVAEIDHRIGMLLKKVGHLGLMSRTLVVVTGYAPDFFHRSKGQRPVRVPLLASFEGLSSRGKRVATPVDLVDIVPTFLELADVAPKFVMDGVSFWSTHMDVHAKARMAEGSGGKSRRLEMMRLQAEARILPHYCGDSVVGLSQGKYTMMFEAGDGHHACMGAPHNPPLFCDRSVYPDCTEWIDLTQMPHLPKKVGSVASNLLNQWKSIEARVRAADPGVRAITEWPVPSFYPCCRNVDVDAEAEGVTGMALEMVHALLGGRSAHCGCSNHQPC